MNNIVATVLSMDFVSESELLDSCDLNVKIDDVFNITNIFNASSDNYKKSQISICYDTEVSRQQKYSQKATV